MQRFPSRAATAAAFLVTLTILAGPVRAAPSNNTVKDLKSAVTDLQNQMKEMKKDYEKRIDDLEKKLSKKGKAAREEESNTVEDEIDDLLDRMDSMKSEVDLLKSNGGGQEAYINISWNSIFSAGTSTAPEGLIPSIEGGHHDPHKRGFTVNNEELYLNGAVDSYFNGAANIVYTIDEGGDTAVELEEAYLQTSSLPYGLQVKAGQMFTEFGRINPQHPHQWDFVDQPVVNTRFFGDDGLRGPGARVSWLTPVSFPLEVQFGMLNANGPTTYSFLASSEGLPIGQIHERPVRSFSDLVSTARIDASTDLTPELPVQLGASAAWGPSGASGNRTTSILGIDFVAKWHPLATDLGYPFVTFQAEWMWRHYPYDAYIDPDTSAAVAGGSVNDSGGYAQISWGFQRDWTIGVRYEHASGPFGDMFGLDDRERYSAALTYNTSHFAQLRLQVNHDHIQSLGKDYTSVWLQVQINLGAHPAHKF